MNLKPLISSLGIFSVLGAGSLGGVYLTTKETVADGLKKTGISIISLDKSQDNKWIYLFNRFWTFFNPGRESDLKFDISPIKFSKLPTEKFRDFFKSEFGDLLNENLFSKDKYDADKEKEGIKKLKEFCGSSYSSTYKTLFSENKDLLENVSYVCSAKNVELIGPASKILFPFILDDLAGEGKGETIDKHKDSIQKRLEELKASKQVNVLDKKLISIKERYEGEGNKENLWRELGEWCKSSVNSYYSEKNDVLSLIPKYCTELNKERKLTK